MKLRVLYFLNFLSGGISASLLFMLPFIAQDLNFSIGQSGLIKSLFSLSKIVFIFPVIDFAKKYKNKNLIFLGAFLYISALILTAATNQYWQLLLIIGIVGGIGFTLQSPLAKSELIQQTTNTTRHKVISNFGTFSELGKFIITSFVGYTVIFIGWRFTALSFGIIPFVLIGIIFVKSLKIDYIDPVVSTPPLNFRIILTNRKLFLALCCSLLDSIASSSVIMYLPFLLLGFKYDPVIVVTINTVILLGSICGKFVLGRLTVKFKTGYVFAFSEFAMVLVALGIGFINHVWVSIILSSIFGIFTKGTGPVNQIMEFNSTKIKSEVTVIGTLDTFIYNIGAMIAAISFGFLGDAFGMSSVFAGFAVVALFAMIPGLLYERNS
ncbi:MAG: MFS transporter [bacterium]